MAAIKEISARVIENSRGEKTVEASIELEGGEGGVASVPAGKSKGSHEAATIEPSIAVSLINHNLSGELKGRFFDNQKQFDESVINFDGTVNKSHFGANSLLALSVAFSRAAAKEKSQELFEYFRDSLGEKIQRGKLRLFANMIEGGLHADNNLRFQEHLVIPEAISLANQSKIVGDFYKALGGELAKLYPNQKIVLSDEGCYSLNFEKEDAPFAIMNELRERLGFYGSLDFGMDAAASDIEVAPKELFPIYEDWRRRFGLIFIEDPFSEEDFDDTKKLDKEMTGVIICGDDLTTTNVERMEKAHKKGSINGVIVKPNQIGTISEALDAVRVAREFGWAVVVSHRSGETVDDWIADFAVGAGADGFKLGAPSRPERIAKYNRLLQIEKKIASL